MRKGGRRWEPFWHLEMDGMLYESLADFARRIQLRRLPANIPLGRRTAGMGSVG